MDHNALTTKRLHGLAEAYVPHPKPQQGGADEDGHHEHLSTTTSTDSKSKQRKSNGLSYTHSVSCSHEPNFTSAVSG